MTNQPLPALDLASVRADATAAIDAELTKADGDPQRLVEIATRLIDTDDDRIVVARRERDEAAMSVREYGPDATEAVVPDKYPRNVRLAEATGVSRPRLQMIYQGSRVVQGGALSPIKFVPNAREVLPMWAHSAALLTARITYARERRDAALAVLVEQGWSNHDLAALMGRVPSRAAHMRTDMLILSLIAEGHDDAAVARLFRESERKGGKTDAALAQRIHTLRQRKTPPAAAAG